MKRYIPQVRRKIALLRFISTDVPLSTRDILDNNTSGMIKSPF